MSIDNFSEHIKTGYACKNEFITLGGALLNGQSVPNTHINIPLKTINRHGLIAGATGTGKTKTIQIFSEQLSLAGIPVLMMDIKGDFSGIAMPGTENDFIKTRHENICLPYQPQGFPVEFLSLSERRGVKLRATITEFGPILFSRILDLNDTQSGVVAVIFKYCDDNKIPLIDLKDFKKALQYSTEQGKTEFEAEYGRISTSTTGAILRKIIELEHQGTATFFGELSFDTDDLMRVNEEGLGYINILRLTDIQDKPKLFSTFMLSLLAEVYQKMPEQGDSGRPELVIFIDEAHLLFDQASKALQDQIETIIKLIRSKGIGIYFITQNPTDIPSGVLSQLGLKIQHALRAFTANDRKAIKLTAQNYPLTDYYDTAEDLTKLGTGEAFVTALNEKGIPTPLAACLMRSPMSRMDILADSELTDLINKSKLVKKYEKALDNESAYEILNAKIIDAEKQAEIEAQKQEEEKVLAKEKKEAQKTTTQTSSTQKAIIKTVTSATFIRGVFGILSKVLGNKK